MNMNYHLLGLIGLLTFTVAYILLLTFCEVLSRKFKINVEYTRKLSHVAAVFAALFFFPVFFKNVGYAVALSSLFFVLLMIARAKNWLPAVDGVDRKTGGSYFLAFGLGATYYVAVTFNNEAAFTLGLLIFAISDPLAGIVGAKWIKSTEIYGGKSIAGSLAFLFSALIICVFFFNHHEGDPRIAASLMIALTATTIELVSTKGTDNFTVPLGVAAILIFRQFLVL